MTTMIHMLALRNIPVAVVARMVEGHSNDSGC
jgi:hypothetical protein